MNWNDIALGFFVAKKTILKGSKYVAILLVSVLSLVFFNLLFIKGFLAGFSDGVMESLIDTSTSHIIILPEESPVKKNFIVNQQMLRKQIETIPGVIATTRHYFLSGTFMFDKNKDGQFRYVSTQIIAFNQKEEKKVTKIADKVVSGNFPDDLKDDEVMIGSYLAGGYSGVQSIDLDGARAGDRLHIVYPNGVNKIYTVRGVFDVPIGFVGGFAFVSDKEAESILSTYDQASEILIRVDLTKNSINEYADKIKAIAPGLKVEKYIERLSTVGMLVDAFNVIALIIIIVSILVASATIFIIIYINALNKKKQIGILKAIGIRKEIIEISYIFQSLFYSVLSVFIGIVLLYFGVIPYLKLNPVNMPYGDAKLVITWLQVVLSSIVMIFASIVAGYSSSHMISKKNIIKIIWD